MALDLTEKILHHLNKVNQVDTLDLAQLFKEDHQKVIGALKSIQANGDLVNAEPQTHKRWELSGEGKEVVEKGSSFFPKIFNTKFN